MYWFLCFSAYEFTSLSEQAFCSQKGNEGDLEHHYLTQKFVNHKYAILILII